MAKVLFVALACLVAIVTGDPLAQVKPVHDNVFHYTHTHLTVATKNPKIAPRAVYDLTWHLVDAKEEIDHFKAHTDNLFGRSVTQYENLRSFGKYYELYKNELITNTSNSNGTTCQELFAKYREQMPSFTGNATSCIDSKIKSFGDKIGKALKNEECLWKEVEDLIKNMDKDCYTSYSLGKCSERVEEMAKLMGRLKDMLESYQTKNKDMADLKTQQNACISSSAFWAPEQEVEFKQCLGSRMFLVKTPMDFLYTSSEFRPNFRYY